MVTIDIEAIYENGVLKLAKPLPLQEHERVFVRVRSQTSEIGKTAGMIPWKGTPEELEYFLGPENSPWAQ